MGTFLLKTFKTTWKVNLLNFDADDSLAILEKLGKKKTDLEIDLLKKTEILVAEDIKEKSFRMNFGKRWNSSVLESYDLEKKKFSCFFNPKAPLDTLLASAVNRALFVFQRELDVIFIHSASVVFNDKLYLFIAPSGGGKSTISSLLESKGGIVLSDEMCVIKKKNGKFYARAIPVGLIPECSDKERQIERVFFLKKSSRNKVSGLSVIEAVRRALPEATCLLGDKSPGEKILQREHVFQFLGAMFDSIENKMLDFTIEQDVSLCLNKS